MSRRPVFVVMRAMTGSILLEVMVATVLVALFLTSLGTALGRSVGQARVAQRSAQSQATETTGDPRADQAWEWGPRVIAGWWRPGPVLHLRVAAAAGKSLEDTHVGLWADGWLVGDKIIAGSGPEPAPDSLQLGPEEWTSLAESELVIRVCENDGSWGPPWRLAVPRSSGAFEPGAALSVPAAAPTAVVRRPAVGNSSLTVSWSVAAIESPPFGLVFALTAPVRGWGGVTLDGRSQCLWWEESRDVDVYF